MCPIWVLSLALENIFQRMNHIKYRFEVQGSSTVKADTK